MRPCVGKSLGFSGPSERDGEGQVPASVVNNVDALWKDLDTLDAVAAAALAGDQVESGLLDELETSPTGLSYEELTALNESRREDQGWGEADLVALLGDEQRALLHGWSQNDRVPWRAGDAGAVAVAGTLGVLASVFDEQADSVVLEGLAWMKKTDVLRGWEKQTAGLPIDYMGLHFGGPAHRVRSGGHDIARIFEAVAQIRDGEFRGVRWDHGTRVFGSSTQTSKGNAFTPVPDLAEALVLLMKHLAADVVTPMSLPLPGWSLLLEMPSDKLAQFAFAAYSGKELGEGLNLRSGVLTPQLGIVMTEIIIRTHVHLDAYIATGSLTLTPAQIVKRTQMLLAAHTLAGAASLSKAAAVAVMAPTPISAAAHGGRHVNIPVLLRVGHLALTCHRDMGAAKNAATPTWEAFWEQEFATWELEEAIALADLLPRQVS